MKDHIIIGELKDKSILNENMKIELSIAAEWERFASQYPNPDLLATAALKYFMNKVNNDELDISVKCEPKLSELEQVHIDLLPYQFEIITSEI